MRKNEKKNEKTILKLKGRIKKMYFFCTGKKCDHFRSLHPHKFGFVTIYKLLTSLNNLPVKVANNFSDTVVKPIMTYNSEVTYLNTFISLYTAKKRASTNDKEVDLFNLIDKIPIANLHLSFCKYVLGIRRKASNLELGRLTVENFIKSQTLLYFARLCTTKLNPLLKECFLLCCQNLDSQGIYTWFSYAKSIIDETGFNILQLQNTTISNQVKLPKKYGKSTLKLYYENLVNNKLSKLDQKSKLYLFSNLKQNLSVESY